VSNRPRQVLHWANLGGICGFSGIASSHDVACGVDGREMGRDLT
jgi:hypothetical protein